MRRCSRAPLALLAASVAHGAAFEIRVTSDRDRLQLGTDREAWVEMLGPEDLTDVSVTTQAGRIDGVERLGPGHFRARYVAPDESAPQVAIVAAVGRCSGGSAHGWLALPLWGVGTATLRARRGANVVVDIGASRFGPVRANRRGIATVPVVVPPGVRYAHDGSKPVDLRLPETTRVHLVAERRDLRADREETIPLRILAVEEDGRPLRIGEPVARAERGSIGALLAMEPGVWTTRLRLPPGPAGPVRIHAAAAARSPETTATLVAQAGPPVALTIELPAAPIRPAQPDAIPIRVKLTDAAGNPARATLTLFSNLGVLTEAEQLESGHYLAECRVPARFGRQRRLVVEARASGERGPLRASASAPLLPEAPASIAIEAPSRAVADGRTPVALRVEVRDRHGNTVSDPAPAATASDGQVEAESGDHGSFVIRWTPPATEAPARQSVEIVAGTVTRHAQFQLEPRPHRLSAAVKVGYMHGLGNLSLPSLGIEGGVLLPAGGRPLWLLAEAGYQHARAEETGTLGALDGVSQEADSDFFPLVASLGWRPRLSRRIVATGSLGGGALFVRSRVRLSGQPEVRDVQAAGLVQAAAGLGLRLGPGFALLEASYRWAADANRETHRGPLSAAGVHLGYVFEML